MLHGLNDITSLIHLNSKDYFLIYVTSTAYNNLRRQAYLSHFSKDKHISQCWKAEKWQVDSKAHGPNLVPFYVMVSYGESLNGQQTTIF